MACLPPRFEECEKTSDNGEQDLTLQLAPPLIIPVDEKEMGKRTLWRVLRIEAAISTEAAFDELWNKIGQQGYRRLSVRSGVDNTLWALVFKGDQAKLHFEEPVTAVYAIAKPGGGSGGQSGSRAIEQFARQWFAGECTSNFQIAEEEDDGPAIDDIYADVAQLSDRGIILTKAAAKLRKKRTPLVTVGPELNSLRALDRKEAKAAADELFWKHLAWGAYRSRKRREEE